MFFLHDGILEPRPSPNQLLCEERAGRGVGDAYVLGNVEDGPNGVLGVGVGQGAGQDGGDLGPDPPRQPVGTGTDCVHGDGSV